MGEEVRKYFAVFGNPVLHSRSPQIYNALFDHDKQDALYTRIHAASGMAVCEMIRKLGLSGANVTTPFKEEVIPWLDYLSPGAEKIGAVNTITNSEGKLGGYNTDASGITGSLLEEGLDPEGKRSLVMGVGGAGKAAASGLLLAGATVVIANRTIKKASDFARVAGCSFSGLEEAVNNINSFDIIVLTLPPGVFPFDLDTIMPGKTIVDANYRSPEAGPDITQSAVRLIRGERWLIHQAVGAYNLFTGKHADISLMDKGLKKSPDPDNLIIKVIKHSIENLSPGSEYDLIVDGRGLDDVKINAIIDEERNKAFGGKR